MRKLRLSFLVCGAAFFSACGPATESKEDANDENEEVVMEDNATEDTDAEKVMNTAVAVISSASGSTLTGEATFTDLGDGDVTFKLTIEGAVPGEHALHLHEKGDCSAPDAKSAGGHWNPAGVGHGKRPVDMQYHAGDISNIEVGEDGKGTLTATISGWSIGGPDSTNILNKAVVIHANADDFKSQPSGAAGDRVGCGVIEKN